MYYSDYEEPSVADSWDPEWGGIHGYAEAWKERTQAEVQQGVEARASTTLAALAATADRVRRPCEELQREVLTVLSPVCDLVGLSKEAELLAKLEDIDWIVSPSLYVQAIAPSQIMSRDSTALSQGRQAPLHSNVEAAIVSNTSTLSTCRDFLNDSIRLVRQTRTKLKAAKSGNVTPAVAGTAATDPQLARALRWRSIALFVLLTISYAGGVVVVLSTLIESRLLTAAVVVGSVLIVAGFYAVLIDRDHARRTLLIAAGVGGAIAAVDQLLAPLFE